MATNTKRFESMCRCSVFSHLVHLMHQKQSLVAPIFFDFADLISQLFTAVVMCHAPTKCTPLQSAGVHMHGNYVKA